VHDALNRVLVDEFEHETVPVFSIDKVEMTVDLKKAKVLWNSLDNEKEVKSFIYRRSPHLRHAVTQRVQLKYSPDLVFIQTDHLNKHSMISSVVDAIGSDGLEQETHVDEKQ
jgi:ribosome-binding factor A